MIEVTFKCQQCGKEVVKTASSSNEIRDLQKEINKQFFCRECKEGWYYCE